MIYSPLEQFEIKSLLKCGIGWFDISIQNVVFFFVLIVLSILLIGKATNSSNIIPTRWQSLIELIYELIVGIGKEQIGEKSKYYLPFLISLFLFVVIGNLLGLVPYSFTVTTQIAVTLTFSLAILIGVTITGFVLHGVEYFGILFPAGTSIWLTPLLVVIELISYLARGISLAVRLSANMMAGHTLLKIIGTFGWKMIISGGLLSLLGVGPVLLMIALTGLELTICILQAYVFTVLTASYINDAVNMH